MSNFNLQTGDILLFDFNESGIIGKFSNLIKFFTKSNYSHIAMVIKDPSFIHPSLKGYYIWESSWEGTADPQDNKTKFGVQITPFHEVYSKYTGKMYIRRLNQGNKSITNEVLENIHNIVYDKPYDTVLKDWINAYKQNDTTSKKIDRFWCSSFVSYILVTLGFLDKNTNWSITRPCDLSSSFKSLSFTNKCKYDNDICIN